MVMQSTVGGCLKAMRLISVHNDWIAFSSQVKVHSSVFLNKYIENNRQKHIRVAQRSSRLSWPSSGACCTQPSSQPSSGVCRTYCTRARRSPTQSAETSHDQRVLLPIILYMPIYEN